MEVTILGNNSALPAYDRHPTSQIITFYRNTLMIDCGEGAQIQMQRYGIKWRNLDHIFISHLHGDHYFGLPGLLNSMSLLGRTTPLHVYGPKELDTIIQKILDVADTKLAYPYHFHSLKENENDLLIDNDIFSVLSFPVEHRIACHGFLIERKSRGRKILPEQCKAYQIPTYFLPRLKKGEDYKRADGTIIKNELVTESGPSSKKYAYCADTIFTDSFLKYINGVNTIYHESTYLENDAEKARMRFHSTARQAAQTAQQINAQQLLLGHFSSKYKDLKPFEEEAKKVFNNSIVTQEGMTYEI